MSEKGWIKLDRKILEHDLWKDKPFSEGQAWIDLLLLANYSPKTITVKNQVIDLQPGQLSVSERQLAERWGWGTTKVRSFLAKAQKCTMLSKSKSGNQSNSQSVITIENWGLYQQSQSAEQSAEQSATKAQPKRNQSTTKESKESKNDKNEYSGCINNINNINNSAHAREAPTPTDPEMAEMGRKMLPGMKHNLDALCSYYGIPLDHHHAGSDSRACASILLRYMESGADVTNHIRTYSMNAEKRRSTQMADFTYEIIEEIGILSENAKGWRKELNKISWNGAAAKYDIRDWAPDHAKMGKGITLTEEEAMKLKELL